MATDIDGDARRRMHLRRGRGAAGGGASFGGGGTGRVESYQGSEVEPDEVDDAIDPDIDDAVRRLPPPSGPTRGTMTPGVTQAQARDDPRSRLNEVAMAGSIAYAREYRLELIGRLLMRKTPLDQIARQLQVSVSTIEKDRAELRRRMREQAKELNIDEMVGGQMAMYDEVQAMALRVASAGVNADGTGGTPVAMKLAAMRTALAANADRTRFLNTAGVFDVLRFRRAEDGSDVSDVQLLMQRTVELMSSLDEPDTTETTKRTAVRRTRPGGFKSMTFDDSDASGSSNEIEQL